MHPAKVACFIGVTSLFLAVAGCSGDDGRPTSGPGSGTGTGGGENEKTPSTSTTSDTSPATPAPSASGTAAAPAPAGKLANAQGPCTGGDQCESGVCFVGGNQSYCAVKCTPDTAATACAAPFTGACNKQGYCKRD